MYPASQHPARHSAGSTEHSSWQHARVGAYSRILIRATNWIGDAVLTEPAIAAVRATFPQAEIALLARPAIAELFQAHPAIDRMLVYEHRGRHAGWGGKWALAAELRRHRFDLAVLLQNAFEAAVLAMLAGIPRRYGYATDGRSWLLTDAVRVSQSTLHQHQTRYYLDLLRPLGIDGWADPPQLFVTAEEEQGARRRLREAGIPDGALLIGLNPGSIYGGAKRWDPDRYAATADRLARTYNARVVIVGARGEEALGESIAASMESHPLVLSGRTSIRELMAVVKQCTLFLTNDTGPMHIAAAFGVPVVAVFGPTDARTTAPFGEGHTIVRRPVDCSPCLLRECPIDHRCMTRVSVDMVYDGAATTLERVAGFSPVSGSSGFFRSMEPTPINEINQINETNQTNQINERHLLDGITVFLDRDGTINDHHGYVTTPEALVLLPGSAQAIARLNQLGARVVVITNQSAVARGLISPETLNLIHTELEALLALHHAKIDAIFYCPHHPDDGCRCRKPEPGLIERAAKDLAIDLSSSYVVGDQRWDIELGQRLGLRSILVTCGKTSVDAVSSRIFNGVVPNHVAPTLCEAVDWIVSDVTSRSSMHDP